VEIPTRGGLTAALLLAEEITGIEDVGSGPLLAVGDLRRQVWARP